MTTPSSKSLCVRGASSSSLLFFTLLYSSLLHTMSKEIYWSPPHYEDSLDYDYEDDKVSQSDNDLGEEVTLADADESTEDHEAARTDCFEDDYDDDMNDVNSSSPDQHSCDDVAQTDYEQEDSEVARLTMSRRTLRSPRLTTSRRMRMTSLPESPLTSLRTSASPWRWRRIKMERKCEECGQHTGLLNDEGKEDLAGWKVVQNIGEEKEMPGLAIRMYLNMRLISEPLTTLYRCREMKSLTLEFQAISLKSGVRSLVILLPHSHRWTCVQERLDSVQ